MADAKLTDLTALTTVAEDDVLYVVDVSNTTDDASGSSRKITRKDVLLTYPVNTVAGAGSTETLTTTSRRGVQNITLDADCTLTFPTAAAGACFLLYVTQDSTGDWSVTWPGTVYWEDGTACTVSKGRNVSDLFECFCIDGTHWVLKRLAKRVSASTPPKPRQFVEGPVGGTATTTTVALPDTPATGALLVAFVKTVGGRTVTTPTGQTWTQRYHEGTTNSTDLWTYTHIVQSAEANSYQFDFSGTAEYNSVILVEVSGGVTYDGSTSSSTGAQPPSITNSTSPALCFFQLGENDGRGNWPLITVDDKAGGPSEWNLIYTHALDFHTHSVYWQQVFGLSPLGLAYVRNPGTSNIPRGVLTVTA